MRSLSIGATGMLAQQRNVEVISNNLANMNTTGFMRRRTEFHDLLYQNLRRVGSTSSDAGDIVPSGVQLGLGVKLAAVYRIHEQGNLNPTDNAFDLAIQGRGFFQIQLPSGETAYTRDGTFQLNADGQLVTHDGYAIQPNITVPSNAVDVSINTSGEVLVKLDGQVAYSNVGQINTAIFPNDAGLESIGSNLYLETPAMSFCVQTIYLLIYSAILSLLENFLIRFDKCLILQCHHYVGVVYMCQYVYINVLKEIKFYN